MKRIRSVRKLMVVLGAGLFTTALLFSPASAEAKDHGNKGNQWNGNGHHDNGNHYGWYKKSYRQAPYRATPPPRDYQYYQGRRGYWDNNSSGVRIFINL